jgi:hypothetical protein
MKRLRTQTGAAVWLAAITLAAAAAGCGHQAPASSHNGPAGGTPPATDSASGPGSATNRHAPWSQQVILREDSLASGANQAVDVANRVAYLLVSRTSTPIRGPWQLRRVDVASGSARLGPTFRQMDVTFAAGYLWIGGRGYGATPPARVTQVNPRTLAVVRTIQLPRVPSTFTGPGATVAAGQSESVWIGLHRTLIRVSTATGAVLARATVPAGLAVFDIAVDPALRHLYMSAVRVVSGGVGNNVVLEYSARSGRRLAMASHGPVTYSVAGSALTAVPGGVWVSFRTGMMGMTLHLRQRDLRLVTPPWPGLGQAHDRIFHWPMYATTAYGGGALWLANQTGIVACIDPRTGKVRAAETGSQSRLVYQIWAVDPVRHVLFAGTNAGIVVISPPRSCWRS